MLSWRSWRSANTTQFSGFKHFVVPIFGLLANLACMLFYLLAPLPFMGVPGMTWKEPYIALGVAALWGLYGWVYFMRASKKKGKAVMVSPEVKKATMVTS